MITKTCLTRPAFGVLVFGVFAAAGRGVGVLTGIDGAVIVGPVLFAGAAAGAAAGAGAAGALDWFPPRAASAARSCEANPLSPPLASVLPTIRAVATLEEAMIRRKRVAVTLPAVSITQRRARVIVVYSFASWLPQREQNRAPGS